MREIRWIAMVSLFFLNGSVVWGQTENSESPDDAALKHAVENKIQGIVWYGARDYVNVEVSEGVVILNGWVSGYWKTDKIQKAVELVPGIKEITNEITVSNGSDELAGRALSAIYRDAMFRKYVLAADLPVHVIVQNNSVILAGKVTVESERRRAELLVDAHTSAAAIDNRLVIEE